MRYRNPQVPKHVEARYSLADKNLPNGIVLEIGCNEGVGLERLNHPNRRVIGMDIDPRFCRDLPTYIFQGDVNVFPFPKPGPYDGILMLEAIEHLPRESHALVLDNIARSLKPGGVLVLSTPNRGLVTPAQCWGHIGELSVGELQVLLASYFNQSQVFALGTYASSFEKELLRLFRNNLCKLGIYDFLYDFIPPVLLSMLSAKMRGKHSNAVEPVLTPVSELKSDQVPEFLFAVAKQPRIC